MRDLTKFKDELVQMIAWASEQPNNIPCGDVMSQLLNLNMALGASSFAGVPGETSLNAIRGQCVPKQPGDQLFSANSCYSMCKSALVSCLRKVLAATDQETPVPEAAST